MYPSYGLPSHVPTQNLFYTKIEISMMQTFSKFMENGCGAATPRLSGGLNMSEKFLNNLFGS